LTLEKALEIYREKDSMTLVQNLVIFAFFEWNTEFAGRIFSSIKLTIRYLKTSIKKMYSKDCDHFQNRVIFNFTFITGFWYWVDSIEKIFNSLKNEIQIKPLRVWSKNSIYGLFSGIYCSIIHIADAIWIWGNKA
jgi:hypothetical protein